MRRTGTQYANRGVVATALILLAMAGADANAQLRQPRTPAPALPAVKSITAGPVLKTGASTGAATGGQEVVLRVELTGPAPCVERCGGKTPNGQLSGHMPVLLSTDNAAQFSMQRMFVRTGETVGEAKFVPLPVASPTSFTISAWTESSAPQNVRLTVQPPVMTHFAISKSAVVSGEAVNGVVHFSGPPASANAVRFQVQTTMGQAVKVPASVTLEPNRTVAEFGIATLGVPQDRNAHVVAMYLGKTLPAALTVRRAVMTSVEKVFNSMRISLDGLAPPLGAVVQLTSANPARMAVPPTVTIPTDSIGITVHPQTVLGNSDTYVRITASYNGVSKHASLLSSAIIQPDLGIRDIVFYDRHDNVITTAVDGQPIKICARVHSVPPGNVLPNVPVPSSVLRVSYQSPSGTGTSTGRTLDLPVVFDPGSYQTGGMVVKHCLNLPGLTEGSQMAVTLIADVRNEVDESREGNNTEKATIARPTPND